MQNTHAVWLVVDAFDWSRDGADGPMDVTGLGEQVDDTTGAARALPTTRTPTRTEREEHDVYLVPYHSPETISNDFGWFLELISRFEFDFRRRGNFLLSDSNFWCVQSSITQYGRSCACAVACLYPHNSISNVVASVTIHDDMYIFMYIFIRDVYNKT